MTAEWDGKELPLPQLAPFLKEPDRDVRERAFRATHRALRERARGAGRAVRPDVRPAAAGGAQRRVRIRSATTSSRRSAASTTRRPIASASTRRSSATSCRPYDRLMTHRREQLRLDLAAALGSRRRPLWREAAPPVPRRHRARRRVRRAVFDRVDPALGAQFGVMIDERLLDLDSRAGKAPGGYCDTLHWRGRPFIFMNAVGLHGRRHDAAARGRARLPRLRRRTGSRSSGSAIPARRRANWPRCRWSCWRRRTWREPAGILRAGGPAPRPARAPRGRARHAWRTSPRWTRSSTGSTPADGARRRGAGRGLAPHPEPVRAGRGLVRAGTGAGRPLVPAAAHLPLPVLLHRVRHRAARRAAGLAEQPAATRPTPCAATAMRWRWAHTRPLPEIYAAAGATLAFDAATDRGTGPAGGGADRAAARRGAGGRLRPRPEAGVAPGACGGKIPRALARPGDVLAPSHVLTSYREPGWRKKKGSRWRGW